MRPTVLLASIVTSLTIGHCALAGGVAEKGPPSRGTMQAVADAFVAEWINFHKLEKKLTACEYDDRRFSTFWTGW